MKLNREQIIKALECCYMQELEHNENCPECHYTDLYPNCAEYLGKHAFALIKELTEENERLREKADRNLENLKAVLEEISENTIVADTVRKMQERLKTKSKVRINTIFGKCLMLTDEDIDQIAKEMLEK